MFLAFAFAQVVKIYFEQASLSRTGITYTDLLSQSCSFDDPNGIIRYSDLLCPINQPHLLGDFALTNFQFARIRVEQCVNTTAFSSITFEEEVTGSTTGGVGVPCQDPDTIQSILTRAVIQVFMRETALAPNSWRATYSYIYWIQRPFLDSSVLTHQFRYNVEHVHFESRFVFDKFRKRERYYTIASEDESLGDMALVSDQSGVWHLNRMFFIFRLDRRYVQQIRDHLPIYDLFESSAASFVFFTGVFGTAGWLINRYLFMEQTKGLDIRKMDRDQFDKFGRLVDKSFQMPRELQDMQAE